MSKSFLEEIFKINLILLFIIIFFSSLNTLITFYGYSIQLELICIFFFVVYKNYSISLLNLILLGLLKDGILNHQIGTTSILFITFKLLMNLKDFDFKKEKTSQVWLDFSLLSLASFLILSLIVRVFYGYPFFINVKFHLSNWLITAAVYPIIIFILNKLSKALNIKNLNDGL